MAKLSFLFRHVSPTYFEVHCFYIPDQEQGIPVSVDDFILDLNKYRFTVKNPADIGVSYFNVLPGIPFGFMSPSDLSAFIRELAAVSPDTGFYDFTFLDFEGNAFAIEFTLCEDISKYFNPEKSVSNDPKVEKKATQEWP